MFGLGASFVSLTCIGAPQQWFSKRRGLAVGISFCGSGVGGLVVANISMAAIKSIGYRWALRIDGIVVFILLSIATCLVRPFGDVKKTGGQRKVINWYLFKNPMFSVMFMHGLITTFGYMVSLLFLFLFYYISLIYRHPTSYYLPMQMHLIWTLGLVLTFLPSCRQSMLSQECLLDM